MPINPFAKKTTPPDPADISGTEALRQNLQMKARKRPLTLYARDLNETLATTSRRNASLDIGRRLAGDGATDALAASIAKSLLGNLPDTPGATVSETDLADFIAAKVDLPAVVKNALASQLYGGKVVFDEATDKLISIAPPALKITIPMPKYVNPDPAIAQAQAALAAAVAVPPVRTAPMPTGKGNQEPASLTRRPGFA